MATDNYYNSENNFLDSRLKKVLKNNANTIQSQSHHSRTKKKHDPDREHIQNILHETDRNVNIIFKSSINNLENIMSGLDQPERKSQTNVQQLLRENNILKSHLLKLKKILREKLDIGLSKQREELSKILEEYISLITKLLQDKEDLTNKVQQIESQSSSFQQQLQSLKQSNAKLKKSIEERDQQIKNAKEKTTEFLTIIQQYQEEAVEQQSKFDQMNQKIQLLQRKLIQNQNCFNNTKNNQQQHYNPFVDTPDYQNCNSSRVSNNPLQNNKVQTLLYLLEESQSENTQLKQQLTTAINNNQFLQSDIEKKMKEIQLEYDQEFMEYQNVIKQTLTEKNAQIQRLNQTISLLRTSSICNNCNRQL